MLIVNKTSVCSTNACAHFAMEVTFPRAETFKRIVDALKELVTEANIVFTKDGVEFQVMDAAHVALAMGSLSKDAFDKYVVSDTKVLGFNLGRLSKLLSCCARDQPLVLSLTRNEKINMCVGFEDRTLDMTMDQTQIDYETMTIPDAEYAASFTAPSASIAKHIKDLMTIGSDVTVSIKEKFVSIATDGEIGRALITLLPKDDFLKIDRSEDASGNFSLRYMCMFSKTMQMAEDVTISLGGEMPMRIEFRYENNKGVMKYYLSPRLLEE